MVEPKCFVPTFSSTCEASLSRYEGDINITKPLRCRQSEGWSIAMGLSVSEASGLLAFDPSNHVLPTRVIPSSICQGLELMSYFVKISAMKAVLKGHS